MNTTKQLSEQISERVEDIPNGFRAIDKDALLNDIRNLYDAVLDLEPSAEQPAVVQTETTTIETQPEPEPVAIIEQEPIVESTPEPAVETEPEPIVAEENVAAEPSVVSEPSTEVNPDEGTLAGKLNQKPITDLRSGIPLNEKFGFIQNLFQNNASDYGDAILKMNNANESSEALSHFDTIADRKGWDVENEQVRTLRTYVERRHILASETNADQ